MTQNHLMSRAARKRSQEALPTRFSTINVIRGEEPVSVKCRWHSCWVYVEWVEDLNGGLLPMTDPFRSLSQLEMDGRLVYTIDVRDCHLSNCIEVPAFVRRLWGGV